MKYLKKIATLGQLYSITNNESKIWTTRSLQDLEKRIKWMIKFKKPGTVLIDGIIIGEISINETERLGYGFFEIPSKCVFFHKLTNPILFSQLVNVSSF